MRLLITLFFVTLASCVPRLDSQVTPAPPVQNSTAEDRSPEAKRQTTDMLTSFFSGQVRAGEFYRRRFAAGLTFELAPTTDGWEIVIRRDGRLDNLAQLTPPINGINPLLVNAQQFQTNQDKDAPPTDSSGVKNRQFIFSADVGRSIPPIGAKSPPTQVEIEQVAREGSGSMKIQNLEMAAISPGSKSKIEQMTFDVSLRFATKNLLAGGGIFKVGGGVSPPKPIYTPDAEYDQQARRDGIQGSVVLWMIVGPDGLPRNIKVARSLGHGLDEKAIEAVKQWRFNPALKDGQPVAVQINVETTFRLDRGRHP